MKNTNEWILVDRNHNLIIKGNEKEVKDKSYTRYVYGHIFDDELYENVTK